jgi:hypothetical protein
MSPELGPYGFPDQMGPSGLPTFQIRMLSRKIVTWWRGCTEGATVDMAEADEFSLAAQSLPRTDP